MEKPDGFIERLGEVLLNKYRNHRSQLASDIKVNPSTINRWLDKQFNTVNEDIVARFDKTGISSKWLLYGVGDMLIEQSSEKYVAFINHNHVGVPFYPMDVTASFITAFSDIREDPEYYIDFKPLNDCTAYFTVFGDSMYPKYASGEIVGVKHWSNYDVILWGEAYLIITDSMANELRTIKLLYPHSDPDKIILRASNPNFNGDTIVDKKNIVNLFIVKGKITRNML